MIGQITKTQPQNHRQEQHVNFYYHYVHKGVTRLSFRSLYIAIHIQCRIINLFQVLTFYEWF